MSTNDPHLETLIEAEARRLGPNRPDPRPGSNTRSRSFWWLVIAVVVAAAAAFGVSLAARQAREGDYTARFLRYETLQDGTRVAVVQPETVGQSEEQIADTDITDLRPGTRVLVRSIGRSWETPTWKPDCAIVSRAK